MRSLTFPCASKTCWHHVSGRGSLIDLFNNAELPLHDLNSTRGNKWFELLGSLKRGGGGDDQPSPPSVLDWIYQVILLRGKHLKVIVSAHLFIIIIIIILQWYDANITSWLLTVHFPSRVEVVFPWCNEAKVTNRWDDWMWAQELDDGNCH